MNNELLYQLALTLVPNIGDVQARILVKHFGSAEAIFKAKKHILQKIEGLSFTAIQSLNEFSDFSEAESELKFIDKYKIRPLFINDPDYPQRLLNCMDAPILLFYKGKANLNPSKAISIVGTRSYSDYGKQFTEKILSDLAGLDIQVISGLAYGIDTIGHKAALKNKISTVGVVGHGLDMIYPPENANLAKEMITENGGILSEFFSGTIPDRHHFPLRNRIVAGMSDATIVIETMVKGGSMITAKLADAYNRDVFALPGKATDKVSTGCNHLIKINKAFMITDTEDLLEIMGWKDRITKAKVQKELFIEMTREEKLLVDMFNEKDALHIDEINLKSGLSTSTIASVILNLELQNIITGMPGKMYRLI